MKRYLITFTSVFLFWIITNMLFLKYVTDLAMDKQNMLYIYLFHICICLFSGLLIGWFSKTKGWLLGLIFGITIITLSTVSTFTSDFFKDEVTRMGSSHVIKQIALSRSTIIFIACSVLGGYLGSKARTILDKKVVLTG
jgi:hypothetical protein